MLIDLGANWCPDCRVLAGVMAIPSVHAYLAQNFELVEVDVGRFDRNLNIPARFGAAKPEGIPAILIVSPSGQLLNPGKITDLSNDRSWSPQAITNWLSQWAPQP